MQHLICISDVENSEGVPGKTLNQIFTLRHRVLHSFKDLFKRSNSTKPHLQCKWLKSKGSWIFIDVVKKGDFSKSGVHLVQFSKNTYQVSGLGIRYVLMKTKMKNKCLLSANKGAGGSSLFSTWTPCRFHTELQFTLMHSS